MPKQSQTVFNDISRVPTRYWKYWKGIEFYNWCSRPWKSIEFGQSVD